MTKAKHDGRTLALERYQAAGSALPDDEDCDYSIAEAEGIEQASREIVETALRMWAIRCKDPEDEIVRFLAHLTKRVLTGEIRASREIPF